MDCRLGCGACCIAPSISSPLPAMPAGKPAGVRCPHLNADHHCQLFGQPNRPPVCLAFKAEAAICGANRREALQNLTELEAVSS